MRLSATFVLVGLISSTVYGQNVTVYYDFEGDFNDHPGAGLYADDLVTVTGGSLVGTAAPALGSTMSYSFDNRLGNQTAQTDAWTSDITSGTQYTIMMWFQGDNQSQDLDNTRLATVKNTAPNVATAPDIGWQVEGFGGNSGDNLDMRIQSGAFTPDFNFFAQDATGALAGVNNDGNETNNEWHHIAFVVSDVGADSDASFAYIETYLDGVSLGQTAIDPSTFVFDNPADPNNPITFLENLDGELIIGGQAGNRGATGLLDDFALFDGIVSDEDILAIAEGRLSPADFIPQDDPATVPEPGSIALWSLIGLALGGYVIRRRRQMA